MEHEHELQEGVRCLTPGCNVRLVGAWQTARMPLTCLGKAQEDDRAVVDLLNSADPERYFHDFAPAWQCRQCSGWYSDGEGREPLTGRENSTALTLEVIATVGKATVAATVRTEVRRDDVAFKLDAAVSELQRELRRTWPSMAASLRGALALWPTESACALPLMAHTGLTTAVLRPADAQLLIIMHLPAAGLAALTVQVLRGAGDSPAFQRSSAGLAVDATDVTVKENRIAIPAGDLQQVVQKLLAEWHSRKPEATSERPVRRITVRLER